jgi:2-methylcitrate dehydratase PrpD
LRTTTALALLGENTADEALYSDKTATRPDVVALRDRVAITTRKGESPTLSDVTVHLTDGRLLHEHSDCAVPAADARAQWEPLTSKFRALVEPSLGVARTEEAIGLCRTLDEASSVRPLLAVLA